VIVSFEKGRFDDKQKGSHPKGGPDPDVRIREREDTGLNRTKENRRGHGSKRGKKRRKVSPPERRKDWIFRGKLREGRKEAEGKPGI